MLTVDAGASTIFTVTLSETAMPFGPVQFKLNTQALAYKGLVWAEPETPRFIVDPISGSRQAVMPPPDVQVMLTALLL